MTPDYLLDVETLQSTIVPVLPTNIVMMRRVFRRQIDHVANCDAPCCEQDDDGDGNCPRHQPGSDGFRNKPVGAGCALHGCITDLPPWTELLLVNTIGQDSSIMSPVPIDVMRARWNEKLHVLQLSLMAMAAMSFEMGMDTHEPARD